MASGAKAPAAPGSTSGDAERLALRPAFDRLFTVDLNHIGELRHQIRVAQQVLHRPGWGAAPLQGHPRHGAAVAAIAAAADPGV